MAPELFSDWVKLKEMGGKKTVWIWKNFFLSIDAEQGEMEGV